MPAYYNELDPFAAQWLRNLIAGGHIAPGEVDERSIVDVRADDLRGYTQCHFFAGIGVWSYALRRAGWSDDRPAWTGSCPCQPFSAAGKGDEFDDARHLWPTWFRLIGECRPVSVFGEQVASKDGLAWLDHVCTDMESAGYAIGAVDTCAAGFGAPHIRQRLYFVADGKGERRAGRPDDQNERRWQRTSRHNGAASDLANANTSGRCRNDTERRGIMGDASSGGCGVIGNASFARRGGHADSADATLWLPAVGDSLTSADITPREWQRIADGYRMEHAIGPRLEGHGRHGDDGDEPGRLGARTAGSAAAASATNGLWLDAEWLWCRDEKWRPTQSGLFPLAHGATQRMGRLRAYGNAITVAQAEEFIRAAIDVLEP